MKEELKDLQFGDYIATLDSREPYIFIGYDSDVILCVNKNKSIMRITNTDDFRRLPRPGELIYVYNIFYNVKIKRHFIKFKNLKTSNTVITTANSIETEEWSGWALIIETRQDKINKIKEQLKNVNSEVYNTLAEIILASKEKVTED